MYYAFDMTGNKHLERFSQIRNYDCDLLERVELSLENWEQLETIVFNYPAKNVKKLGWRFGLGHGNVIIEEIDFWNPWSGKGH